MDSSDDNATNDEQHQEVRGKKPGAPPQSKMEAKKRRAAKSPRKVKTEGAVPPELKPGLKKPHRFRPGTTALREIRQYQKSAEELTQMAPFDRQVRVMLDAQSSTGDLRVSASAMKALKVASEYFLTELFQRAQAVNNLTEHDTLRDVEVRHAAGEMGLHLPSNGKMACSDAKLKRFQRAQARATARRIKGTAAQ